MPKIITLSSKPTNQLPPMLFSKIGWQWVGLQYLVLSLIGVIFKYFANENDWWLHGIWCVIGMFPVSLILLKLYRSNNLISLVDHRVISIFSFASFFLLGASMIVFGSENEIINSETGYPCDAKLALLIDGMNAFGLGVTLILSTAFNWHWVTKHLNILISTTKEISVLRAFTIISIIGLYANYKVNMQDFGMYNEEVISGTWRTLSNLSIVAIFLGASFKDANKLMLIISLFTSLLLSFFGLLIYSKTAFLTPIIAIIFGISIRNRKILAIAILILISTFYILGGAINYARILSSGRTNISLEERLSIIKDGLIIANADESNDSLEGKYSTWSRYYYLTAQAAAIDFYDAGIGGNDIELIPWLIVPRTIVPSKPVTTNNGVEFYYKITGHYGSSTGQGVYASGYYNLGWLGVVLAAGVCGASISLTSAIAYTIIANKNIILIPLALAGFYMAYGGMAGNFVSSYLGFLPFLLFPIFFGSIIISLLRR